MRARERFNSILWTQLAAHIFRHLRRESWLNRRYRGGYRWLYLLQLYLPGYLLLRDRRGSLVQVQSQD